MLLFKIVKLCKDLPLVSVIAYLDTFSCLWYNQSNSGMRIFTGIIRILKKETYPMKKLLVAITLSLSLMISFTSCGGAGDQSSTNYNTMNSLGDITYELPEGYTYDIGTWTQSIPLLKKLTMLKSPPKMTRMPNLALSLVMKDTRTYLLIMKMNRSMQRIPHLWQMIFCMILS